MAYLILSHKVVFGTVSEILTVQMEHAAHTPSRTRKWALFLALAMVLGTGIVAQAQTADGTLKQVETAIRAGDAEALAAHFHTTVEVTIGENDNVYQAAQAKFVLKDFFQKHSPRSFSILHKGNTADTYYAVGAYVSSSGTNYDTNIFLKKVGARYVIEQIRFEADL